MSARRTVSDSSGIRSSALESPTCQHSFSWPSSISQQFPESISIPFASPLEVYILQSELPVSCSIGVPIGHWHHHFLKPWSLDDVAGKRWLRHVAVLRSSRKEALWCILAGIGNVVEAFSAWLDSRLSNYISDRCKFDCVIWHVIESSTTAGPIRTPANKSHYDVKHPPLRSHSAGFPIQLAFARHYTASRDEAKRQTSIIALPV